MRYENRPKVYRTLAMLCESESLSDAQLKAYQTRLQYVALSSWFLREYRTYLEAVSRLANCGNVCITEEAVMIGDNGLLTGESLNALQHAGAISVYNTLQQNNWEFPVPEGSNFCQLGNFCRRRSRSFENTHHCSWWLFGFWEAHPIRLAIYLCLWMLCGGWESETSWLRPPSSIFSSSKYCFQKCCWYWRRSAGAWASCFKRSGTWNRPWNRFNEWGSCHKKDKRKWYCCWHVHLLVEFVER